MSDFEKLICNKINTYKKIIKKNLPAKDYSAKVNTFGLKTKSLKEKGELFLFNLSHEVLSDLESMLNSKSDIADLYSGASEFASHLKEVLLEYRIQEKKVVHVSREASRSLVEAVQLISLPASRFDDDVMHRLKSCGYIVAKYGTGEQVKIFFNALKKHETKAQSFFYHLMTEFKSHLNSRIVNDSGAS